MDRHARLLWMKEVIEHLNDCHQQWHSAEGSDEYFLAESMKRDLDELRRICELLRGRTAECPAVAVAGDSCQARKPDLHARSPLHAF